MRKSVLRWFTKFALHALQTARGYVVYRAGVPFKLHLLAEVVGLNETTEIQLPLTEPAFLSQPARLVVVRDLSAKGKMKFLHVVAACELWP